MRTAYISPDAADRLDEQSNGLCEFQGINHVTSIHPVLAGWGTKLWGHYTTTDWIHFFRSASRSCFRIVTGTETSVYSRLSICGRNKIHYFYTGNVKLPRQGLRLYILEGREQNHDSSGK